ncbi:MAG: CDP-diacylglycerol--glycerol-3-phosphate 3-phosphatidyltransferase, partial [Actinomycetota bacterium]
MSWATAVTITRIALVPVFVYFMYAGVVYGQDPATRLAPVVALAVFAVAALTDSLDGYLARRYERVTRLGQFLDPLADKLLVGAALFVLVALRDFPLWAAAVIVVREVAVSLLRVAALRRGRSLPASALGKIKTALQIPTVFVWLLPRADSLRLVQDVAVWVAVALTVLSGLQYFARAGTLLAGRERAEVS